MWFGSDLQKVNFLWFFAVQNQSGYNLDMPKIRFGLTV